MWRREIKETVDLSLSQEKLIVGNAKTVEICQSNSKG